MARKRLMYYIFLANSSGRFEDTVSIMKQVAMEFPGQLNRVERNMLNSVYKQKYKSIKYTLKSILNNLNRNYRFLSEHEIYLTKRYMINLKEQMNQTCYDIINLLEVHLLPNATDDEQSIFYLLMIADFHRYLIYKLQASLRRDVLMNKAQTAYKQAQLQAYITLAPLNPVRLATTQKFMVYVNDILLDKARGCVIGRQMLEAARAAIERGETREPGCNYYMNMIQHNVKKWTAIIRTTNHHAAGDF